MAKQTRNKIDFTTIRVEGAILPADLLVRIAKQEKDIKGLREEEDYHLSGEKFKDAITQSWNRLRGAWANFQSLKSKLTVDDTGTTITREKWLLPLFQQLGYGRLSLAKKSIDIEDKSYPISHTWEQFPIHLVGCGVDLDKRSVGALGVSRSSPHSMVQELLNRSKDYLWAFVSNGLKLRILRDNISLTRQAYVEFDLESMMQGEVYPDFSLLWLLCHQSRVEGEKPEDFWLEKWSKIAQEQGTRFLDKLRKGVEKAISLLGSGFLANPNNKVLRSKLQTGQLNAQDYYRQLLRLVYRLLFLFVAEDRELLLDPNSNQQIKDRYNKYYSTARLRKLAGKRKGTKHNDLWQGLRIVMQKIGNGGCTELGLPALGSFLFSNRALPDLDNSEIDNIALLETLRALAYTEDGNSRRSVDYKNLRSEELGSVYESLLELHPVINAGVDIATFELKSVAGNERKTTSSYYTPDSLVQCLLDSALDPVVDDAIKGLDRVKAEEAILNLKVCDPACGSGHFLVAAAHRMAKRLASIRTGDTEPSPPEIQKALRNVIGRCIYGVDINEMAVELCKVALWMEAIEPGKPLSFLEHHIQCGNSLLGTTPALMANGIPDEAFNPIEGDDKKKAAALKKQNKKEREGQQGSFLAQFEGGNELDTVDLLAKVKEIDQVDDSSISGIRRKQELYEQFILHNYKQAKVIADAWCAAFVWKKTAEAPLAVTHDIFWLLKNKPQGVPLSTLVEIERLATQYKFFHWHLAFPGVFRMYEAIAENKQAGWSGGFDIVLGNPPWDKFTISEEEWFSSREQTIASTKGKSRRDQLIKDLINVDPELFISWQNALRDSDVYASILTAKIGLYPLTGSGELNTYHLFTERSEQIVLPKGYVGLIVKTGIGSADNCLSFFKKLTDNKQIVSLFDFVNTKELFPQVQTVERFSLITFTGEQNRNDIIIFATLCQEVSDLNQPDRKYTLSPEDISLMSPINGACPLLKCTKDADIMRRIYRQFPVLGTKDTSKPDDYWNIDYVRIFDMANDSEYFKKREELEKQGFKMDSQRRFITPEEEYWPLYEGKYIYLMEHRYGTFENVAEVKRYGRKATAPDPTLEQLQNPFYEIVPRYWFPKSLWLKRQKDKNLREDFQFHFRDIAGVYPDLRTAIGAICPANPAGDKAPALLLQTTNNLLVDIKRYLVFTALFCSLLFDYIVRNKLFSKSLKLNTLSQIPLPSPKLVFNFNNSIKTNIEKLALELSFTTWSLEGLGKPIGYSCPFIWDEERRFLMLREIDATIAHFYGLKREEFEYIISTFQTLEKNETARFGKFRTKEVALNCYDKMQEAIINEQVYQSILSPPPADPSVAHPPRETL